MVTRNNESLRDLLPSKAIAYLDGTDFKGSSWGTAVAVAFYAMHAGLDEIDYTALICDSAFAEGLASDDDGRDRMNRLDSRIARAWKWAEERFSPGSLDPEEIQAILRQRLIAVFLFSGYAKGQRGISQRMLAIALVLYAMKRGNFWFPCGVRTASWLSGIPDTSKASKLLKELADLDLILLDKIHLPGEPRPTSRVRLPARPSFRSNTSITQGSKLLVFDQDRAHPGLWHDVFVRTGLGPVAGWVWAVLDTTHQVWTVLELAALLNMSRQAITKACESLEWAQLAHKVGQDVLGEYQELDDLADKIGVLGYRDDLERRYAEEQVAYRGSDWAQGRSQALQDAAERKREFEQREREFADEAMEKMAALMRQAAEAAEVTERDPFYPRIDPVSAPPRHDPFDSAEGVA